MDKNNKKAETGLIHYSLIFLVLILLSINFISAFGVSTPYWKDNPLKLAPGESTVVTLNLQNRAGAEEDITLKAEITSNSEIASLVNGPEYFVAFGSSDVPVKVKVSIPSDIERGGPHEIALSFSQISTGEGGMVRVAGGITSKMHVYVVASEESILYKEKAPKDYTTIIILIALILLILVLIYASRKKRKKKSK